MITSAPSARSSRAFSCDILSGMVKMQRYPFTAAAIASPTPVLPDVASTIRPPGLSRPSRSAASIIASPIRSFTEPPGLKYSALAYTGVRIPWVTRFSRTSGVQPIVSRMLPYGLAWDGIRIRLRRAVWNRACRVQGARERVPLRRRRIAPRRAHWSRCGSGGCAYRSRSGTRGVRLSLRDGATRLRVAKLDRLEERRGNRQAVPPCRSETQLARAHEGRPVESTNKRRITSPSTFWSYKRGGYWIGESPFRATGGSWSGGTPDAPLPDCSAGGAWRHPAGPTAMRPASATVQTLMVPPRVASSTPPADSALRGATGRSRPGARVRRAADAGPAG